MKTIVLTNHYDGRLMDMLDKIIGGRFRLRSLAAVSRTELLSAVSEADYLLSSGRLGIDEDVIGNAPRLRMVQRTGVGVDRIDLEALRKRGIPLYVNAGVNAQSVAEYTIMLMLNCLKNSGTVMGNMRAGRWDKTPDGIRAHEMAGKKIGIIGMGNVGRAVARFLYAFGTDVMYYSRTRLLLEMEQELHIRYTDMDELLGTADIITLHCPYDKRNGTLLTRDRINRMKDGAILINTARGRLVDEKALLEALEDGKLSGCGMDTFEEEPLPTYSRLRCMEQAILSPHIAGLTAEAYGRMLGRAIDNIWHFDRGDRDDIESFRYI